MTNKNQERFAQFEVKQPSGVAITSGSLYLLGRNQGSRNHIIAGVAATSQPASGTQPFDTNAGYFTLDCEGVFNLSVIAQTSKSPSAGAAIAPGDEIFADGGTYDVVSGITYGNTLDADANGTFVGIALDAIAAGQTATIRVILKNAPCA